MYVRTELISALETAVIKSFVTLAMFYFGEFNLKSIIVLVIVLDFYRVSNRLNYLLCCIIEFMSTVEIRYFGVGFTT